MDKQGHLTLTEMDDYLNQTLNEAALYAADDHLASCEACSKKIWILREIDLYSQQWTPAVHGEIFRAAQLELILDTAAKRNPALNTRIKKWLQQWGSSAGAAVQAVWKLPGEMTRLVDETMGQTLPLRSSRQFSFAELPARVQGRPGLTDPLPHDPIKAQISGEVFVEVSLDELQGNIEVCLRGVRQAPPLVLLVNAVDQQALMVQLPEYQLETNCFLCQFSEVPSGNYLIVVEPWD